MTIINKYLLSTFLRITALALGIFTGIYLLIDFFEKVDDFLEHNATISLYFFYFSYKLPLIISQVLPLTILMGVFLTLGGFSKSNELTAMRAGGISLLRLLVPLILAATFLGLIHFALNEYIVPAGVRTADHILRTEVKGKTAAMTKQDNLWFRDQNTLYHIDLVNPKAGTMSGVTLYAMDDELQVEMRTDAAKVKFADNQWMTKQATIRRFDTLTGQLKSEESGVNLALPLSKQPGDFSTSSGDNEELNFTQLRRLSRKMRQEGLDAKRYLVDMYARLAAPVACLIMAFVAIPFALQKSRNVNLSLGISISVLIGVAFFIVQSTLMALGYTGVLPPFIAAWAADIIFLLFSCFLILSTRD